MIQIFRPPDRFAIVREIGQVEFNDNGSCWFEDQVPGDWVEMALGEVPPPIPDSRYRCARDTLLRQARMQVRRGGLPRGSGLPGAELPQQQRLRMVRVRARRGRVAMAGVSSDEIIERVARLLYETEYMTSAFGNKRIKWGASWMPQVWEKYRDRARVLAAAELLADPEQQTELENAVRYHQQQHAEAYHELIKVRAERDKAWIKEGK